MTLLDTTREPFMNEGAIAFRLECSLEDPAAGNAAPGAAAGAQAAIDKR